jgi:hypothetical protein
MNIQRMLTQIESQSEEIDTLHEKLTKSAQNPQIVTRTGLDRFKMKSVKPRNYMHLPSLKLKSQSVVKVGGRSGLKMPIKVPNV